MDEVGRGAWAGPVSVGVAVLAGSSGRPPRGLRDSKLVPEDEREELFGPVAAWCAAWAVGHAEAAECDRLGMTGALRLAARRALDALPGGLRPDAVVLDGPFDYLSPPGDRGTPAELDPVVRTVVDGDARCASVAAASVLAKVTRDRIMRAVADSYPPFDFHRNKGYPSPDHRMALRGYGLSAIHRRSWSFVGGLPWR